VTTTSSLEDIMPHTDLIANRLGLPIASLRSVFGPFWARVQPALAAAAKAWDARRAERVLMEMPDHLLKDIGVARADIRRAVRQGWI
jgi:uncharacterized protein YjiS (DUF1127 family)